MTARLERRNGGGFAGIAEFLSRLRRAEFGSPPEGINATAELFRQYNKASLEASMDLAKERGVYPLWEGSKFQKKGLRVRNSCMTNNAPTGTLAQALQTSWGVDPHNGIVFSRKVRSRFVDFVAPGFKD
jgi:ribonucleoside-diphosphate reductase alpha chain